MENNYKDIHILYVDDEPSNLTAFKASFRRTFQVFTAESAAIALEILEENEIHVIISDQRMPDISGTEFLEQTLDRFPDCIRMLLTGYSDIQAVINAINKGQIYKYFTKPWDEGEMEESILRAYQIYHLKKEKQKLTEKLLDVNKKLEFMLRQKLLS